MSNNGKDKSVELSQENMIKAEKLVADVLARTGIKRKLLWEETRCSLLGALNTMVNSFKAVPGVNWVATLVEKPLVTAVKRAECRKNTRKGEWRLAITNEVRNILNEEYKDRSSEELKSTPTQFSKAHIDKVAVGVVGTIMTRARNLSNKIAMGVSCALAACIAVKQPWVLPIAVTTTCICVYQRAKINKKQITVNVDAKSNLDNRAKEVINEHTQILENSQYYGNIANFSSRMAQEMRNVSEKEIETNNKTLDVIKKNSDKNVNIDGFWATATVAIPMAMSFFDGGLSALATTGVLGAASCSTCTNLGVSSTMNFLNSKFESDEAIKMVATHIKHLDVKDKKYTRGSIELDKDDNVIFISKDMAYQHRDFSEDGAPLLGEDVFRSGEDIVIGKGITVLGGASGAGKSTLTALLRKGALATEGSIQLGRLNEDGEFSGVEYKDIANIVDNVGVAFQSAPRAESITVDEYIKIENPNADPDKVKEVKDLLGIGVSDRSGMINENDSISNRLSGGQQKRIELARVLIKDSPIMILDEPTSGVDEVMSDRIVDYLKELGKEKTIVYITHDAREIEKIGAVQAIDIDKHHSEDGTNIIKTFDLTDKNTRDEYIKFFENRRNIDMERNANLNDYHIAVDVVSLPKENRLVYNKEYLEKVRGKLRGADKSATDELVSKAKTATVAPVSLGDIMEV